MQTLLHHQNDYIIRLEKGEEFVAQLTAFCRDNNIHAGSFTAIGAATRVIFLSLDAAKKTMIEKEFVQDLEIDTIAGTISVMGGEIVVHGHGTFSSHDMIAFGGHVKLAVISATCEISLRAYPGELVRKFSEEVGINLLTDYKA